MSFDYKEIDVEGQETLEAITEAKHFNKWMYETILPHCQGKILEVGSGIGNISQFFISDKMDITLSDIRMNYLEALQQKFPRTIHFQLDLVHPQFTSVYKEHLGSYDTIFALNVIEHIEDHELAMNNINRLLTKNGKVIILVPAFQSLYNKIDHSLYHFRRYNKKSLSSIFNKEIYEITKKRWFNFTGIFAWFIGGKLMGDQTVKKGKMSLYNRLVPLFKIIDIPMKYIAGLSVIVIAKKIT